jgi:predicted RNase H-like HicB family nuclease
MSLLKEKRMNIEYDRESRRYFIVWQPPAAAGAGKTEREALEDLREAAPHGIDTMVERKREEIGQGADRPGNAT